MSRKPRPVTYQDFLRVTRFQVERIYGPIQQLAPWTMTERVHKAAEPKQELEA